MQGFSQAKDWRRSQTETAYAKNLCVGRLRPISLEGAETEEELSSPWDDRL